MKKILIVDDEDDIREVAQLCFEVAGGWEVISAESGSTAIEMATAAQPDVILMDVMMPDMDGPTTFRHLQDNAQTRGIPVILLTAKVQASDREQFSSLGVRGVIAKPFDPMRLADDVEAALDP